MVRLRFRETVIRQIFTRTSVILYFPSSETFVPLPSRTSTLFEGVRMLFCEFFCVREMRPVLIYSYIEMLWYYRWTDPSSSVPLFVSSLSWNYCSNSMTLKTRLSAVCQYGLVTFDVQIYRLVLHNIKTKRFQVYVIS